MQRLLLAVVLAFAVFAYVDAEETTCQSHRRNSQTSDHGMNWNITCDENGHYYPLQCNKEPEKKRWCACYNKEEAITSPSRKTRTCVCPLAKDEATNANASECDIPRCENTGKYTPKQCCSTTGKCHCVNPNTGERTTEPSTDANLQCSA